MNNTLFKFRKLELLRLRVAFLPEEELNEEEKKGT